MADPFPPHDHAGRRSRLRDRLRDIGVDGLYVTRPANVRYLTGFTGSNGQAVLGADGTELLITDSRYLGRAATESPDLEVVESRRPHEVALDRTAGRLAFEGEGLTYEQGMDLISAAGEREQAVVVTTGLVEQLRMVKETSELARLREACRITEAALAEILPTLAPGRTERSVAVALERTMVDLGADGLAFDLIVAGGPNGAIPHHEPGDRPLARGDLVVLDIGARVGGYHADMTRTVAIGSPPRDLEDVHGLVHRAQAAGVAAAVAGATCEDVDRAARSVVEDAGHGDQFTHGIGHGVGLDVHEAPILSMAGSASLEAGMAVTVEPGVYLPGIGGVRIEDTIVVTADGPPERLTTTPRALLVL